MAEGDTPTAYRFEVQCRIFAPVRVTLCSEAVALGVMTLTPSFIDLTPANYKDTFVVTIQALSTAADYRCVCTRVCVPVWAAMCVCPCGLLCVCARVGRYVCVPVWVALCVCVWWLG
jgi:hypothetical protein